MVLGTAHGWLYALFFLSAVDLALRAKWTLKGSALTILAGTVPLLLVSLSDALRQDWQTVSLSGWLSIVYLAIFPVYIAYILWNYAIARRGVAKASSFGLLVPIVAGLLSAIFVGEPFGPLKLLGAGLVLAGLVIVRTRVWRRPAAKGATT